MKNIAEQLTLHAASRPDHPAIIDGARTIGYGELNGNVARLALGLRAAGVGVREIVGLCLEDHAEHLMLHYAIARLGAAILPMDVRWTLPERARVAEFFGARITCVESGDSAGDGIPVLEIDPDWLSSLPNDDGTSNFPVDEDFPVALSLSSGTTGRPKGPMINHSHLLRRFENQRTGLTFSADDRYLNAVPLYFGAGRHFTLGVLFQGGTVILLPPPFSAEDLVAAANRSNATFSILVPTILRRLLELDSSAGPVLGGLRMLFSTGAILHSDERAAVLADVSPHLINYYGSTEGGGISTLHPDAPAEAVKSVGRPLEGTAVQIVDQEDNILPTGEVGWVRYSGPCVADNFFNDPEASVESFKDGWFYPGDLGRFDQAGYLYLVGRSKDVIIRGGVNIYPAEIEQVLLSHEQVREAAVVAWPSKSKGEEVAAFVVVESAVAEEGLKAHCAETLARYKVPREIFFVDEMPRNAMGKITKPALSKTLPALTT